MQIDVLASSEFGVESGAYFDERGKTATNGHLTPGRSGDARQKLENCGFAGAIVPNNTQHFSLLNFETNVVHCPNFGDGL